MASSFKRRPRWADLFFFTLIISLSGCSDGPAPHDHWENSTSGLFDAVLTRDGKFAVIASFEDGASFWDISNNERRFHWRHSKESDTGIRHVGISPDSRFAITADSRAYVVWNTDSGQATGYWSVDADITDAAIANNGRFVLLGLKDGRAVHIDQRTFRRLEVVAHQGDWVTSVAISADGRLAASGGRDGRVVLWDTATGSERHILDYRAPITLTRFDAELERLLVADERGAVSIVDVESGNKIARIELAKRRRVISAARFSKDGQTVLIGFPGRDISLWNTNNGKQLKTWRAPTRMNGWIPQGGTVFAVAFDATEQNVLAQSSNGLGATWAIR